MANCDGRSSLALQTAKTVPPLAPYQELKSLRIVISGKSCRPLPTRHRRYRHLLPHINNRVAVEVEPLGFVVRLNMAEVVMARLLNGRPNALKATFQQYAQTLDQSNERRERLVKASRDVTLQSKKVIFHLHRMTSENSKKVLQQAVGSLQNIRKTIGCRIAVELDSDNYYRFHRAFSPGIQEYVEARAFLSYLEDGSVVSPQQIEEEIGEACEGDGKYIFIVDCSDYVQGIADLTGEMMRRAVAAGGGDGVRIHDDLCGIEQAMESLTSKFSVSKDMAGKMRVLHASVTKVQRRCFDNAVRSAEVIRRRLADSDDMEARPSRKKQKTDSGSGGT